MCLFYIYTITQKQSFELSLLPYGLSVDEIACKFHCIRNNLFTFHHFHNSVCEPQLDKLFAIAFKERC